MSCRDRFPASRVWCCFGGFSKACRGFVSICERVRKRRSWQRKTEAYGNCSALDNFATGVSTEPAACV